MKYTSLICFVFLFFSAAFIKAQNKPEGEIKYKIQYEGESIRLNIFFQGTNLRIDKQQGTENNIFLFANGITCMLYPEQKIFVEYEDINDKFLLEKPPLFENTKDDMKLVKTKEKLTIMGVECEKWILKNQVTSIDMFVNREMNFDKNILRAFPKYFIDWQETLLKESAFPLLVKIKDELGNTIYTFEAVDLNMHGLSENIFVIPQGYRKSGKEKI